MTECTSNSIVDYTNASDGKSRPNTTGTAGSGGMYSMYACTGGMG